MKVDGNGVDVEKNYRTSNLVKDYRGSYVLDATENTSLIRSKK
jgi:hypothetical protein